MFDFWVRVPTSNATASEMNGKLMTRGKKTPRPKQQSRFAPLMEEDEDDDDMDIGMFASVFAGQEDLI